MKSNFTGLDIKAMVGLAIYVFGLGITYGVLTTRLNAQEGKTASLESKMSGLASKEDVYEVRKDLRAFAQGRELPRLREQSSPSLVAP
jgi:hypothetical protein